MDPADQFMIKKYNYYYPTNKENTVTDCDLNAVSTLIMVVKYLIEFSI